MIGFVLGRILMTEAALLLLPMGVGALYGESLHPFLIPILALILAGILLGLRRPKQTALYARDGFAVVALAWILMSAFGALPFVLSGDIPSYVDAFFETVSGFTTTGATILGEIESLPKGILFWRSFTHWIGGMGVLVFMLAILPSAGGQAIHLLRAETTGPQKGKLVPKLRQTAMILYGIYFVLTVVQTVLLCISGLSFYDSLVTAFATAGTGGFSVKNASIAGYANPAAEWITAVFMLIFGVNFNLYFFLLVKKFKSFFKSEELRAFLLICLAATAAIAVNTWHLFTEAEDCLRSAFFQVTSILSTAGFSTHDFNLWPDLSKTILVFLMIIGSCAGSTAGGLKVSRVLIVAKNMLREIKQIIRPRSVNTVRLDGEAIPSETLSRVSNYISLYFTLIVITTLLLSIDGFGLEVNITSTLTCINNVGPGLGAVGPTGNFGAFSVFSKLLLSLDMLIGRLEILPMLIFFTPAVWRKY